MTVQGSTVRSPLTACQVTSRPRYRFWRYSKWLDTFWTGHVHVYSPHHQLTSYRFVRLGIECRHVAVWRLKGGRGAVIPTPPPYQGATRVRSTRFAGFRGNLSMSLRTKTLRLNRGKYGVDRITHKNPLL